MPGRRLPPVDGSWLCELRGGSRSFLFRQFCPERLGFCCEAVLLPAALRPVRDCHFHEAALQRRSQVLRPEVILMPKAQCLLDLHATHSPLKHQHEPLDFPGNFPGDFPGDFRGGGHRVFG
jgi:hypothetical protein